MLRTGLCFLFVLLASVCRAQTVNDDCSTAFHLDNVVNYCSDLAQFDNIKATPSNIPPPLAWNTRVPGKDVWFSFIALHTDVQIAVIGDQIVNGVHGGTLKDPLVALYESPDCALFVETPSSLRNDDQHTASLYAGALVVGRKYFIRISSDYDVIGSFKLCVNNYQPPVKAGQDLATASFLCSKQTFTEFNVTGPGSNNLEATDACFAKRNSAWYKWQAKNNGTLTFTITPTSTRDDIDWVLYDLGPGGNDGLSKNTLIRCAAGHGVDIRACPGDPLYYRTGLNMIETDTLERVGCGNGQNGFLKHLDMKQGHVYALLVDNYSNPNNSFTIEFGGTGEFVGPEAAISYQPPPQACPAGQTFVFSSASSNYARLKWDFGKDADMQSSDNAGPHTINYSSSGMKTIILQAFSDKGCITTDTLKVYIGPKPAMAVIDPVPQPCPGDIIVLNTPYLDGATYSWTGPNNFKLNERVAMIPAVNQNVSGNYSVVISYGACSSDPATVVVPPLAIMPKPAFQVINNDECTALRSFTVIDQSQDVLKYEWLFGEGANIATADSKGPHTVSYSTPGYKTIQLNTTGEAGCTDFKFITHFVPPLLSTPAIGINKPGFCLGDTMQLKAPIIEFVTYQWSGPGNFSSAAAEPVIIITDAAQAGTYTLVMSTGNCSVTASVTIPPVIAKPVIAFRTDPSVPNRLSVPASIKFYNETQGADRYLWDFGDGHTSAQVNPEHAYTTKGKYAVTLTAWAGAYCNASFSKGELILDTYAVFIPNTFTPNGDGINDTFAVGISNLNSYKISIFNRLGIQVYGSNDIYEHWDGTYKGDSLPAGVYYYVISGEDIEGAAIRESGPVTILR